MVKRNVNKALKNREGFTSSPVVSGILAAAATTIIAAAALALLLMIQPRLESFMSTTTNVVNLICVFIAGLVAGKRAGRLGWVNGGIAAGIFFVLTYLVAEMIFPQPIVIASFFKRLGISVAIGVLGGIAGINVR